MQSKSEETPVEDKYHQHPESPNQSNHLKNKRKKSPESFPTDIKDEDNQITENPSKQLVVYNPASGDTEIELLTDSTDLKSSLPRSMRLPSRTSPSIGAFTVQCSQCFQWRIIPTKEKYEEIRENILQDPFYCEKAEEWGRKVSCSDEPDIRQDGTRLWAIDKPNIARPPRGWERLLRIRNEGGSKFADVYYVAPCGKRMRSMVEVQKYMSEHPEYLSQGVNFSQFSFLCPRPLQENYVKKRPARFPGLANGDNGLDTLKHSDPEEVKPLLLEGPDDACTDLQIGRAGSSSVMKKKSSKPPKKPIGSNSTLNQSEFKVEDSPHFSNAASLNML